MTKRHTIVGLLVLASAAPSAQTPTPRVPVPAVVHETQALLIAAYPELRKERVAWRVATISGGAIVEARYRAEPFDAAPSPPLVAATVAADEHGRVQELRASGTLIDAARQPRTLRGAVRVKFAPDTPEALDALVPEGISARLGAPRVRARTFIAEGTPDEAQTWRVEIESTDVVPQRYTLVFEPVEGRLLSVVRR